MNRGLLIKKDIDVLIASYGGVGTSFLADAVSKFTNVNNFEDEDGHKHLPLPPLSRNTNLKILYVVGDPSVATISLFRRNYASFQSFKLNQFSSSTLISPHETLDEYACRGEDRFNFEAVFNRWDREFQYYPTLVLKYSAIHDNLKHIQEFLELPKEFIDSFPTKKERNSNVQDLNQETKEGLDKMYKKFGNVLHAFPVFYIRPKRTRLKYLKIITCPFYLKAIFISVFRILKFRIKKFLF
ncbi:MAG: hypothetical protein WA775_13625 [Psychroserpens sp.]|uniref:hypothetical protein n=1 Tax=Psychroserpens sp. TaxID=2020870 RepID=UPI003C869A04